MVCHSLQCHHCLFLTLILYIFAILELILKLVCFVVDYLYFTLLQGCNFFSHFWDFSTCPDCYKQTKRWKFQIIISCFLSNREQSNKTLKFFLTFFEFHASLIYVCLTSKWKTDLINWFSKMHFNTPINLNIINFKMFHKK